MDGRLLEKTGRRTRTKAMDNVDNEGPDSWEKEYPEKDVVVEFVMYDIQAGKGKEISKRGRHPCSEGFVGTFDTCRLDRREGARIEQVEVPRCMRVDA